MARIQGPGLIGQTVSVGVNGGSPLAIANYGVPQTASGQAFTAITAAMSHLDDGAGATSVEVLTQPAQGRIIARDDGTLAYDARGAHDLNQQAFQYRRTVGGSTETVDATISMTENMRPAGPAPGDYYLPETDAGDNVIVYPGETARRLYVSNNGLTDTDILARHSGTPTDLGPTVTAAELRDVIARDGSQVEIPGTRYGETEALALHPDQAAKLYVNVFGDDPFEQWWVLYERGGSYPLANVTRATGLSRLQPMYLGTYGAGAAPVFPDALINKTSGNGTGNLVVQGPFVFGFKAWNQNMQNTVLDNLHCDRRLSGDSGEYPVSLSGIDFLNYRGTLRRYSAWNIWHQKDAGPAVAGQPALGPTWSGSNGDRVSGGYAQDGAFTLIEKCFTHTTGWEPNYYPDRRREGPKSPEDASHGFYTQGDNICITMRDMLIVRPCFSAIQMRSGGVMNNVISISSNGGFNLGNGESPGPDQDPASTDGQLNNPPVINGQQRRATHMSIMYDWLVTEAGERDMNVGTARLAGGLDNQQHLALIKRGTVINGGEQGTPIGALDQPVDFEAGRVERASETYGLTLTNITAPVSDPGYFGDPDVFIWKWSPSYVAQSAATGLDTVALDALSTGGFTDQWQATTGATQHDFVAALEADAAPWAQIGPLLEYYQSQTGQWVTPRTTAATCVFRPEPGSFGIRADISLDWSTGDLPGTVAGDSVDILGFDLRWNISPDNDLVNVNIRSGGRLEISAGRLNVTGALTCAAGGDEIAVRGGARLRCSAFAGERAQITMDDGLYHNLGTCAGNVDLKVVCDSRAILADAGGAFTFGAGDTLTIGGYALAGADGTGGGTGRVTFETGSKLRFQAGARLTCSLDGQQFCLPRKHLTGATSGATAVVEDFYRLNNGGFVYKVFDLSGPFTTEQLTGEEVRRGGAQMTGETSPNCGSVTAVETAYGQLRTFRSGVNGFTAPNMTFEVVMGGTLEIDMAGHEGALAHTLIVADTLSGAFDTVSVLNLGARDATVTIGTTEVTIAVTIGGTGQVSVL